MEARLPPHKKADLSYQHPVISIQELILLSAPHPGMDILLFFQSLFSN